MNILKRFAGAALLIGMMLLAPAFCRNQVWAATTQVYFDSQNYEVDGNEEFQVTVFIQCDEQPGTYSVELVYDQDRLQYLSGADVGADGTIKMQGTAISPTIEYQLTFMPINGGNAGIYVSGASVTTSDGKTPMSVLVTDTASIKVLKQDTTGKADFAFDSSTASVQGMDLPIVGAAAVNDGSEYSIINLEEYVPDVCHFTYQTKTDNIGNRDITVLTDTRGILSLIYLVDPSGNFYLYSYGQDGELYPCLEGDGYYYMSPYASTQWPADLTPEQADSDHVFVLLKYNGEISFCKESKTGTAIAWNEVEAETETEDQDEEETDSLFGKRGKLLEYSGFIIIGLVIIFWIIGAIIGHNKRKKRAKARKLVQTLPSEDAWANAVKQPVPTVKTVKPEQEAAPAKEAGAKAAPAREEQTSAAPARRAAALAPQTQAPRAAAPSQTQTQAPRAAAPSQTQAPAPQTQAPRAAAPAPQTQATTQAPRAAAPAPQTQATTQAPRAAAPAPKASAHDISTMSVSETTAEIQRALESQRVHVPEPVMAEEDISEEINIADINLEKIMPDGMDEEDNLDQLATQLEEILGSLDDSGDDQI